MREGEITGWAERRWIAKRALAIAGCRGKTERIAQQVLSSKEAWDATYRSEECLRDSSSFLVIIFACALNFKPTGFVSSVEVLKRAGHKLRKKRGKRNKNTERKQRRQPKRAYTTVLAHKSEGERKKEVKRRHVMHKYIRKKQHQP